MGSKGSDGVGGGGSSNCILSYTCWMTLTSSKGWFISSRQENVLMLTSPYRYLNDGPPHNDVFKGYSIKLGGVLTYTPLYHMRKDEGDLNTFLNSFLGSAWHAGGGGGGGERENGGGW